MVPDNLRAALVAVTLGSLVALSGIGIGGAVAVQQPSDTAQSTQLTDVSSPSGDENESSPSGDENESSPSGDEVVERFEERVTSLESLVMTYETNATIDDNTMISSEQRMWVDYENNRVRTERETDRTHVITVRNESQTVIYDVEKNQVDRFNTTGDVTPPTPVDALVTDAEITYEGRERLDGEETYRLDVTPTNTSDLSGSVDVTVWLDTETYFPTTMKSELEDSDYNFSMTAQFRNVSLNESISDDRFTIDVPDDAEEPEHSVPDVRSYESLSALRNDTNQSVPSPDVPEAYSFEEGYVIDGEDRDSVTLRYATDDGETFSVVKRPPAERNFSESDTFETVDAGNHTGYYRSDEHGGNTTSTLVLPCEDTTYSVFGTLSKTESIDIARSLTCE